MHFHFILLTTQHNEISQVLLINPHSHEVRQTEWKFTICPHNLTCLRTLIISVWTVCMEWHDFIQECCIQRGRMWKYIDLYPCIVVTKVSAHSTFEVLCNLRPKKSLSAVTHFFFFFILPTGKYVIHVHVYAATKFPIYMDGG